MSDAPGKNETKLEDDTAVIENIDLLMDMDVIENENDWDAISDMNNKELDSADENQNKEDDK